MYVTEQNYNDYSTYEVLLDANNLYGGIIEKFSLLLNEFETLQQINLEDILNIANDKEGYIVEVDLHYPDKPHDSHKRNFIQGFGGEAKGAVANNRRDQTL